MLIHHFKAVGLLNQSQGEMRIQEAIRRAAVEPGEVLHVGDQVRSDVAGARAMGMKAALLDRGGWHDPVDGCPKIAHNWAS